MPLLHIALQEGFEHEPVEIRINGKAVFDKPQVITRRQIGFADSVEADIAGGAVELILTLPQRALSGTRLLQVTAPTYVGVSVAAQGLEFKLSQEPFGYL